MFCAKHELVHLAAGLMHAALGGGMRVQHAAAIDSKLVDKQRHLDKDVSVSHLEYHRPLALIGLHSVVCAKALSATLSSLLFIDADERHTAAASDILCFLRGAACRLPD